MKLLFIGIYGFVVLNCFVQGSGVLEPVDEWNVASYDFEFDAPINDKSFYNPENVVTTGIAVSYDRIFVANPRLFSGVPSTVNVIPRPGFGQASTLKSYPDWSFHTIARKNYNCSDLGLVSVYRLRIDSCNRLWALDSGISRSLEDYEITCPPKILVFDLATDQVVRRIDFPREVRRGESLFTNLIIDETTSRPENGCDDVFVYISDTVEPAIVVYDSARDLTWRLTHPAMYPDPDFAQTEVQGDRFILMDGIVGLGFDPKAQTVYFQPLATDRLFSVSTQTLRAGPIPVNQILPVRLVGKKSSQGVGLSVSPSDGSIFFSPMTETALASWNPNTNQQKIHAYDPERLQFVADLTFSKDDPGALYAVSSRFQKFFLKNLNPNDINTRIMRIQVDRSAIPPPNFFPPPSYGQPFNNFPSRKPQLQFSTRQQQPTSFPKVPTNSGNYFSSIRQPYQFETTGLVNRGISNPFTALNAGEQIPRKSGYSFSYPPKANPAYGDFNSLRVAKSISVNSTATH